ncbi:septum site-determining protein MinC [Photobacterium galatheae]|nr:septum site-determining protein MinC [Photobacterium galatheae]
MSDSSLHISKHLRTGNFYCQELVIPHKELTRIMTELEDLQRRFTQTFSCLNIVLNFSELHFEEEDIAAFVMEAKHCLERLGHHVVGAVGIKSTIATACGIKPIRQKLDEAASSLIIGKEKPEEYVEAVSVQKNEVSEAHQSPPQLASMIIEESIRGGQSVYAENKNLVIIGDVKRGAEIAADFSITVFGKLEGRAHAGVNGSTTSTIVSHNFDPELVSINGTYLANQDILEDDLGKVALVQLKEQQNKIIIRAA